MISFTINLKYKSFNGGAWDVDKFIYLFCIAECLPAFSDLMHSFFSFFDVALRISKCAFFVILYGSKKLFRNLELIWKLRERKISD